MIRSCKEALGWIRGTAAHRRLHFPSEERYEASTAPVVKTEHKLLRGKKAGLVVLSSYPFDARPRRTADELVRHGMSVDYICAADGKAPWHEKTDGLDVFRVPIEHR